MKKRVLAGLFLMVGLLPCAQAPGGSVQDLSRQLLSARGRARVDLLNRLAAAHAGKAPDKEMQAATEALALARTLSYRPGEAAALYAITEAYEAKNDFPRALEHARQALDAYRRLDNGEETARCLRKAGDLLFFTSRYEDALEFYFQALDRYERLQQGDTSGKFALRTAYVLTTIGNVLRESGKTAETVNYYLRALQIYERLGNQLGIAGACVNLGGAYQDAGRLDLALPSLLRGRDITRELDNIDDFKRFNDLHGHDCGDRVLSSLAGWVRSQIRAQDFVGRWGGEEFILVLPETPLEGGRVLLEKLRGSIAGMELSYQGQPLRVSMTFGLSVFNRAMSADACLKVADQALYQGKREGKDRVVVRAEPGPPPDPLPDRPQGSAG